MAGVDTIKQIDPPLMDESALAKPVENPHDQRFKIIGTCEHCRFWNIVDEYGWGACDRISNKKTEYKDGDILDTLVDIVSPQFPGKDFGCIHWEGKE